MAVAFEALSRKSQYRYLQEGKRFFIYPPDLFSAQAYSRDYRLDCSAFFILVYKAAGAPDPNETDYNGRGNTISLAPKGIWTEHPLPGDAVFYGGGRQSTAHMAIYIGDGEAIGFGGNPMRRHDVASFPLNFVGYMTFLSSFISGFSGSSLDIPSRGNFAASVVDRWKNERPKPNV